MMASIRKRSKDDMARRDKVEKDRSVNISRLKYDDIFSLVSWLLIIVLRLCAAVWTGIGDCDEVYNYWEPAHYLVYNKGFQTWEYSPVYAIRSYMYVWLHTFPVKLMNTVLTSNKIVQFYFVRICLALVCCVCEVYFYRGVKKQFGVNTNHITRWILLCSAGMFIASTAFLPSSFSMYMTFVSMGAWFLGNNKVAIVSTAASSLLGWPFVAVLGLPIALDIIVRQRKVKTFISCSFLSLLLFLIPMIIVDSSYYGKLVIAPLNIVLYNVFSQHGPELYGVEPLSYYLFNGLLNFNCAFIAALISFPVTIAIQLITKQYSSKIPVAVALSPMYIWIAIFFATPHKEERFLFPIYPLFALATGICIDQLQHLYCHLVRGKRNGFQYETSRWIPITFCCVSTVISAFRILALYTGYHASIDIYMELHRISKDPQIHPLSYNKTVNVCVGKDWYRYPSSFFLPNEKWHLRFLKSNFKGQLPQPYDTSSDGTKIIPANMNDKNLEEKSRYFDVTKCHYLIDLELDTALQVENINWKTISTFLFLNSNRSHRLFRAFYIPFFSKGYTTYTHYQLLQSKENLLQ